MNKTEYFIDTALKHELPYDPVKAHEYYLRTRELKGKNSVSGLRGKGKKEGWAYTKNQIDTAKKGSLKTASESQKVELLRLRNAAQKRRELLSERVKMLMTQRQNNLNAQRDQINKRVESEIAALPEIPDGLSKEETAGLVGQRNQAIAKILGDAKTQTKGLSENAKQEKTNAAVSLKTERENTGKEIKASLESARQKYKLARKAILDNHQSSLDTSYNNIRDGVSKR